MPFTITDTNDLPDGTYKATLEKVEIEEGGFNGDGFRKWHWLVDVGGVLTPYTSVSSQNTGPKSKTFAWLTGLLGRAPASGEVIEDPVGRTVLLTIVRNEKNPPYGMLGKVETLAVPEQVVAGVPR